jgi:hypothetical protein
MLEELPERQVMLFIELFTPIWRECFLLVHNRPHIVKSLKQQKNIPDSLQYRIQT